MGFFVSDELDDAFDELLDDVAEGVSELELDGKRRKNQDPEARLNVMERLERREAADGAAAQPHFGLRFTKLIPPGGG